MTTETMTETPIVTTDVLEDLRELLAESLRTQATVLAGSSFHLEETGDAEAAHDEMGIALLLAWLADNVQSWTHTTRLRDGLVKFNPMAGAANLAILLDDAEIQDPEWRP